MPVTNVLRQRIQAQIDALQEKLRAIDLVEQMERELAEGHYPKVPVQRGGAGRDGQTGTMTGTILDLLSPDAWMNVVAMVDRLRPLYANVGRSAVAHGLRRLHERGLAERRGKQYPGYEYRKVRVKEPKV